ncbi:MAG TPA: class I SAM-dependent methyltransferase [Verrucomicrobiae bacterium]|nr:class I SAM-dependent methyltransferase [Verrucomicrobiae bacterium]
MEPVERFKMWARPLICPFDQILGYLPDGVSSFDIGCGTGYLLCRIAATKHPSALGGIEIRNQLIQFAQARIRQVSSSVPLALEIYDGHNLPEILCEYDYVWMVDVLHHIPIKEQRPIINALADKMKAGAVLILKDIDAGRPVLCLANKLHDLVSAGEFGHERSRDDAAMFLRESGLDIIKSGTRRMWVYPHYWYVCRKQKSFA